MTDGRASPAALLILDMINDLTFKGAQDLLPKVDGVAETILKLREEAARAGAPTIYVNDNYGHWHSDQARILEACAREDAPGRDMVRKIAPREDDYFVVKPRFSGFYATALPVLLPKLGIGRLILTGIAADICVLFTAADAHMREYDLWIPRDAVASEDDRRTDWALDIMAKSMGAEVAPTSELAARNWIKRRPNGPEAH